jgi:adenine-specific DNA methylase
VGFYYANHQKKGALRHLKVADIFMGGGTTLVEGARLGVQMFGTDLNPVAWFVVKNELAKVDADEVKALLADIEAEVKPQIMPFYACDCPRGHRGTWTHISSGKMVEEDFNLLSLKPEERKAYRYEGPEVIYVFWAKHGPCQITRCGHKTPIMSSPVMAVKTLSVKVWENHRCRECRDYFDIEEAEARMAPGVPLVVAEGEKPYTVLEKNHVIRCPHCGDRDQVKLGKGKNKKVELTLLVHPQWLAGSPKVGPDGREYGGSATDTPEATAAWNRERACRMRLLEVRGVLPEKVTCPETGITFETTKGTVPRKSNYACGACGTVQDVLETVKASGKTGPVAAYAIQGYCPTCDREGRSYGGRFFVPVTDTSPFNVAVFEWTARKESDLAAYWPRSEIPFGFMTSMNNGGLPNHGYTHWWTMFNPRQLLVHTQMLRAIATVGGDRYPWEVREFVLGAFQQYLRNQCMFSFWHLSHDHFAPTLSNTNYHPKSTMVEVGVFIIVGYGPWPSTFGSVVDALEWANTPWELVSNERLQQIAPSLASELSGKSEKVLCGDPVGNGATLSCCSATDLSSISTGSYDLVITDPPFGGLLHYSELADFFYVWLRLVLKGRYPEYFSTEHTPKALEAVSNRARQPEDPEGFYKRLLTECWREAHRVLKPGGILAFTFHHSEDEPWIAVLESLFDAGFYLEAAYPIRSDETKGEGAKPGTFGSQKIEYDIIHVCRKRMEDPKPVSWGRMRREVLQDVRHLQALLEHHAKAGLPAADLQVIKRGKALEYFSRHYGKIYVDEEREVTVRDALLGINQLLDEESGKTAEPPPVTAEPFTRQFLRIFDSRSEQPRDQVQKYLRGTGIAPNEFEERGWCREEKKIYHTVPPLEIAHSWQGRHRRNMVSDYDQAMFLIGACFDGSRINASDTLNNENFRPHPALRALLEWHTRRAAMQEVRNAAARALVILQRWESSHQEQAKQLSLFYDA